jgi:DNA-binding XRE family transcriptional regulator
MKVRIRRDAIRRVLAKKNMSQNWLAMKLQTSTGYMSQLITGTRNPSSTMRMKILHVLGDCQFDDIFELDE